MNNPSDNIAISSGNTYLPSSKGSCDFGVRNVFKDGGDEPNKDRLKHAITELINRSESNCTRYDG